MATCETCVGAGKISCGACWGGQRTPVCPDCLGKGYLDDVKTVCARCHGLGKMTPPSCPFCGNNTTCPDCGGKGEI